MTDSFAPLWRGDVYRALALGFDYPSQTRVEELAELLRDLKLATHAHSGPGPLAELMETWSTSHTVDYQTRYHQLFDQQSAIGYCEAAYRRVDRGAIHRDVSGFYRAFGFVATAGQGQPDSLRHELGIMAFLMYKEWAATERGWTERAQVSRDAQASFLKDHLGLWAPAFATRLQAQAGESVYSTLARALAGWLTAEGLRYGVPIAALAAASPS